MTRKEAITVFKAFMDNPLFSDIHKAAFSIAIHDIKQRHDWDINNLVLINKDNYEPLEQEPTTKNNLAVDCVARQAAITFVCKNTKEILKDTMPLEVKLSDDYLYENVAKIMRNPKVLPPGTPIRPKGHWIVAKGGSYLGIRNACCSNCKDFYTNDWQYMNYCPNCGAKMVEPQEREVEDGNDN